MKDENGRALGMKEAGRQTVPLIMLQQNTEESCEGEDGYTGHAVGKSLRKEGAPESQRVSWLRI